jgi:hypothetical protein
MQADSREQFYADSAVLRLIAVLPAVWYPYSVCSQTQRRILPVPGVTDVAPDLTIAVNVAGVPDATVVIGETFNEVVAMPGGEACASSGKQLMSAIPIMTRASKRRTV